ncbi:MAG TPA: aspartyl/asparaginyl beta-hydroxylase domain-containing protein [Povalibacter sp.]|uniref:aspartyl/asparaginyl beta-hydroxylase domain-containing protein n=1 Tax=Povalibacter sp. TaxID=1962978 RepID=UPI002C217278|nr:aspartyl/asparaginyl beta-hydroxylase domain-containing protein [Povalibacter sp.]HMN44064.1 aspartyl/asparaginyl beta-hydroxylase domain-containing protein [Povalibacter sp.]
MNHLHLHSIVESVPRLLVLAIFAAAAVYTHLRGRVRHRIGRQLTDHSTFMAPYNALMYLFSAVPARPFLDLKNFPELAPLKQDWEAIRDEAMRLFDEGHIRAASKYNDLGFNSFFKSGWKRFYLKWYGDFLPSANALCPHTTELLSKIPNVHAAMFALLPPGARLPSHRDPFAGSLRYHLGLRTPNNERCYITVDGELYYWKDGEAVMFDETYIHRAENQTDVQRLILFCDVERPLSNPIARALNRWIGQPLARAAATQNMPGEKVGVLNQAFQYAYQFRLLAKRLKQWDRNVYYLLKWVLLGSLVYAIFLRKVLAG